MGLILASTSPYRRALLARLGLPFTARAPRFEELTAATIADPAALVTANALGKARDLASQHPEAIVIGGDQTVVCAGRVLGKPGTVERAVAQLLELAGREHELLTAVALIGPHGGMGPLRPDTQIGAGCRPSREETAVAINRLRMRRIDESEARAYVLREQPLDCAGAYKSEGLGIALFESIRGDDPTAVVGLPLIVLCGLLRRFGLDPLAGEPGGNP